MHNHLLCVVISSLLMLISAPEVYEFYYEYIIIGSPEQTIYITLSLTTDVIFMISANCGELNTLECPNYCYNSDFGEMYCTKECQRIDDVEWCKKPIYTRSHLFKTINSSTFALTGDFWTGNLEGHSRQIGQWAQENISFTSSISSSTLQLEDWLYVSGMIVDLRLIYANKGILGLAPGKSNFVQLLYEQNRIPKPVVSMSINRFMTLGDYNSVDCSNWWHKKAVGSSWILKFDSVHFLNQTSISNVVITFDFTSDKTYIPDVYFDLLFRSSVIVRHFDGNYHVSCDVNLDIKFTADTQQLVISSSAIIERHELRKGRCTISVFPIRDWKYDSRMYVDEPQWVFGSNFYGGFCLGYNYETNEIAIGNFIVPS
ncbi:hypothetical protein M3Y95_01025700 [Aphelenchoides besseyi]|nr:hypothetical protein M3Y95_01025700 [Aphelenchoides besseyi]